MRSRREGNLTEYFFCFMGSFTYYVISREGEGSFTYYVISRGGGGFKMLTVDFGGLAVDYVIIFFSFFYPLE